MIADWLCRSCLLDCNTKISSDYSFYEKNCQGNKNKKADDFSSAFL